MKRPLVITANIRAAIAGAIVQAQAHPIPWEVLAPVALSDPGPELRLKDRKRGALPASIFVEIPVGYRAAISFEQQPAGLCRHLSVSVESSARGDVPNIDAFRMIAKEFGIELPALHPGVELPAHLRIWMEEFAPGEMAINVVQVEGPGTGRVH